MTHIKHIGFFILISLFGCNPDHTTGTMRISKVCDSDRFSNTMVESRFFTIYTGEANTITTGKGNLLIIPSGSLLDKNGDIVDDSVIVEFAEATELDEIILCCPFYGTHHMLH